MVLCDGVSLCRNSLSRKKPHQATELTSSTVAVMVSSAAAAVARAKATSLSCSEPSSSPTKKSAGTLYSDDIAVEGTKTGGSSPSKERDLRRQLLSKQKRRALMARLGWQRKT